MPQTIKIVINFPVPKRDVQGLTSRNACRISRQDVTLWKCDTGSRVELRLSDATETVSTVIAISVTAGNSSFNAPIYPSEPW
jgi:hypothetical protein